MEAPTDVVRDFEKEVREREKKLMVYEAILEKFKREYKAKQ